MKFSAKIHVDVVRREPLISEYSENAYVHIDQVRAALDQIPEEYRAAAQFEIGTWRDRDGCEEHSMSISYERPPTEAEIKEQIADARKRMAEEVEWFQKRAEDMLREAAECGYNVPEDKWPFKAGQPAPLEED